MVARATPRGARFGLGSARRMMLPLLSRQPRTLRARPITFLNQILAATGARMVISSSWRLEGDCRSQLIEAGVTDRFHSDWATDADGPSRGDEIARWLGVHRANSYVVLDDWPHGLEKHRIQHMRTDFRIGLTAADVGTVIGLLIGAQQRADPGNIAPTFSQ
ncbi:HAD domain-containing protein [Teichococcus aerophilus]